MALTPRFEEAVTQCRGVEYPHFYPEALAHGQVELTISHHQQYKHHNVDRLK
jgi:hypothetical protein